MTGPCAKQRVIAIITTPDGKEYVGENDCLTPQSSCPRAGMASGEGYELCKSACNQTAHAEVNAISKAGADAEGATLFLIGHNYVCDDCQRACDAAGIAKIIMIGGCY